MKKLVLLTTLVLSMIACKKTPPPAQAPTSTTSSPTTTTLSHQDSVMLGDWILDTYESYTNGSLTQTIPHNDPVNCHLNLMATIEQSSLTVPWKDAVNGMQCAPHVAYWRITGGQLDMGIIYTIVSVSGSSLVLQYGSMSGSGAQKYYFHK